VSDDLGLFAHPRPAIVSASRAQLLEAVAEAVTRESAGEVVVGIPLGLHGADTAQSGEARQFAAELRARLGIPVTEWDERLSTVEAGHYARGKERRRTGDLDSAAAAIILQSVIESRRSRAG
jgi:putative Holliday junction resolvase